MKDVEVAQSKEPSDEVALQRIRNGATSDFAFIVERYQHSIYSLIMRQTGDENISQELAQETFLKAFKNISKFRGDSAVLTWLTRIALNVTNSYFDSRRYKETRSSVAFDTTLHENKITNDNQQTYPEELIQALQGFLATLKSHHREVIVLCALEGKSYQEAADILQIPIGTVSSRMTTALKQLREKFQRVVL